MPILDVELVADRVPPGIARSLADAAGAVFGSPPGRTWVRVRALAPAAYAENAVELPSDAMPVFVTVTKHELPARPELALEVDALTRAIAGVVGRPVQRVHVQYASPGTGRVAFGGVLVG
jgi:phenylpyruvate tautomerase PptA (4-oxalocrotonate tautomerase family)